MWEHSKKCGDLTDTDVYKMATELKTVVSSLIQVLRKWQHLHLGTETKTVVSSLIQLLGKRQHCHLGTETKTKHCHITDTVVRKRSTSPFGNSAQDLVEHVKCRQKMAKI